MIYTLEEIYLLVGKEDKTAVLTFKTGSNSFDCFGQLFTVVFLYTQDEREELDARVQKKLFERSRFVKVRPLIGEWNEEELSYLRTVGIHSDDIVQISYSIEAEKNTFHSTEKRSVKKLTIPMETLPNGGDLDWMYGFKRQLVTDGVGLTPHERNFYLAGKFYYEPDTLTDDEIEEIFSSTNCEMADAVKYEFLSMKYMRGEISDTQKEEWRELIGKRSKQRLDKLDNYLHQAGSSLKRLYIKNLEKAVELTYKVERFEDRRLNVLGLDSYLHIYMRHVEEMKINRHFEHKDNFQWDEEDVLYVMEQVIHEHDEVIQDFFINQPGKRFSLFGPQSAYFQGDYYTLHIDPTGRVHTFHKNKKSATDNPVPG